MLSGLVACRTSVDPGGSVNALHQVACLCSGSVPVKPVNKLTSSLFSLFYWPLDTGYCHSI